MGCIVSVYWYLLRQKVCRRFMLMNSRVSGLQHRAMQHESSHVFFIYISKGKYSMLFRVAHISNPILFIHASELLAFHYEIMTDSLYLIKAILVVTNSSIRNAKPILTICTVDFILSIWTVLVTITSSPGTQADGFVLYL